MIDNKLPNGWELVELGECLHYEQPTKYIVESTDYSDTYKTPVLTAGKTFVIGYTNETNGIYADLPVIIFDDFTTSSKFVNFQFKVKSSAMKILSCGSNRANIKFLYYLMQILECNHDTHKRYWISVYSKMKIPLPPLYKQEQIVEKIEELFSEIDKGVDELEKIKKQLKLYRKSVLKDAFEGKITEKWRNQNENSKHSNIELVDKKLTEELAVLPKNWNYVYLSKLGDLGRGKSKHRPRNDPKLFINGRYPFVQTGEIKSAKRILTSYEKMYSEFGLKQSKLWPIGTLCITIAANIAETAFLGIEACFPDSIVGFKNNEILANIEYIEYFIQSAKVKLWAFAPATAQKNINLNTLENLVVPYCSLAEQKQIVLEIESRLSVCDKIEQIVEESLQKSESLYQSILKKAFEGKLIPQEEV